MAKGKKIAEPDINIRSYTAIKSRLGERHGKLLIVALHDKLTFQQRAQWVCQCDCGNFLITPVRYFTKDVLHNCGCEVHVEKERMRKIKHKASKIAWTRPGYREQYIGENSYNWKGGKYTGDNRKSVDYLKWRKSVYERDEYICQICGVRSNRENQLNAHHLHSYNDFPDMRLDISNGITLCENHHTEFHMQYGYGHNWAWQYEEFTGDLIARTA